MKRNHGVVAAFALTAACSPLLAHPVTAQGLYEDREFTAGVQARTYSFDNLGTESVRQVALPVAVIFPVTTRFSIDIGAAWARTTVTPEGAPGQSFSGFTDTQIRGAYVFGRDAVVATLLLNLPTGEEATSLSEFAVVGAASSSFLSFPVPTYGTGTSVTGGLAAALPAGAWNFGLAGSLRISSSYEPFSGQAEDFTYDPGIEGRVRVGVDRLVGSSRLTAGFTFSTFGTDEFRGGGGSTVSGSYQPGDRFIAEIGVTAPAGNGLINAYVWDFYRSEAGGAAGLSNAENVLTAGVSGSWPIARTLLVEPLVEARFWSPEGGTGRLLGGGLTLLIPLGGSLEFAPGGRFDTGKIEGDAGGRIDVTGWEASALLRYRM